MEGEIGYVGEKARFDDDSKKTCTIKLWTLAEQFCKGDREDSYSFPTGSWGKLPLHTLHLDIKRLEEIRAVTCLGA